MKCPKCGIFVLMHSSPCKYTVWVLDEETGTVIGAIFG